MSVYNHRPMGPPTPSRLMELLDAVKNEYDQLAQEVMVCKSQRDEYEHKSTLILFINKQGVNVIFLSEQSDSRNEFVSTKLDGP